jgi:hypothetical protein
MAISALSAIIEKARSALSTRREGFEDYANRDRIDGLDGEIGEMQFPTFLRSTVTVTVAHVSLPDPRV